MNNTRTTSWNCVNCGLDLSREDGSWRCVSGHTFDVAKDRYVSFMTGRTRPGIQGDTVDMFTARRRFLGAGHYGQLMGRLVELVRLSNAASVYDVGCGEGSYVRALGRTLPEVHIFGTDLSRDGIRAAAKSDAAGYYAVADTMTRLPFADGSLDVVLDVFAPRNPAEFARILRPDGEAVVVVPGAGHLDELRARYRMIAMQPDKLEAVRRQFAGWRETGLDELRFELQLDAPAVTDLLAMTPNAWFRDGEAAPDFDGMTPVTVEFDIIRFSPPAI